ncbi:MAG: glycosyltransferase [Cyanobacteria bacterium P01_F01_bin.3]
MKISHLSSSVSRLGGGIMESVLGMTLSLSEIPGVEVSVLSVHDKHSDADSSRWGSFDVSLSKVYGPRRYGFSPDMTRILKARPPQIVHVHGLWMYPSRAALSLSLRSKVPYLVTPHGMLDDWALKNSYWKKRLVSLFQENLFLENCACIHALCEAEYESIRELGIDSPIAVIPNGVSALPGVREQAVIPKDQTKKMLFLGRLHPKKGLLDLLSAWDRVSLLSPEDNRDWELIIAGWGDERHTEILKRKIDSLPGTKNVKLYGPAYGQEKADLLNDADVFVLPSYSEGLPMSVLEAWSCGKPTLMTEQCNVPDGFKANASLKIETGVEGVYKGLREIMGLEAFEREAMGKNALSLQKEKFDWAVLCQDFYRLYSWVLSGEAAPEFLRMK